MLFTPSFCVFCVLYARVLFFVCEEVWYIPTILKTFFAKKTKRLDAILYHNEYGHDPGIIACWTKGVQLTEKCRSEGERRTIRLVNMSTASHPLIQCYGHMPTVSANTIIHTRIRYNVFIFSKARTITASVERQVSVLQHLCGRGR